MVQIRGKEDLRMCILVNQDVILDKAKLAIQVSHSVSSFLYKSYTQGTNEDKLLIDRYMMNPKKILLSVPRIIIEMFELNGYLATRDEGVAALNPNVLTCINLGIIDYNNIPQEFLFIKNMGLLTD